MVHSEQSRTYVMGYWPIPTNAKRSLEHYSKHLALSLEMLAGQKLYFLTGNAAVLSSVEALCKQFGIELHARKMILDEMPKRPQMDRILDLTKDYGAGFKAPPTDFQMEKGLVHYWRDLKQADDETFKKVFSVWHSKIDLLRMATLDNPFGTQEFAWVDASISRFNGRRAGWDFRLLGAAQPGKVHHYPNDMRKAGKQLALNASFLLGDAAAIERLHAAYEAAFRRYLEEAYPNDEETVLDSIVTQSPELFLLIQDKPAAAPTASTGKRKVLVVGTFRSGTNAMQACLESYFDVEVTFNDWFWKHGVPPTGIQSPVPPDVPIIVMAKSPFAFHESLYPFWEHRRPGLDSGGSVSAFARKELVVFDVSGGNLARPKYWYRWPIEYWNQFYYSWLSWTEVRPRCQFVRCEDFEANTDAEVQKIAERLGLRRIKPGKIALPGERVGPHVPTERKGERYLLTPADRQWIGERVNPLVARTFGYIP